MTQRYRKWVPQANISFNFHVFEEFRLLNTHQIQLNSLNSQNVLIFFLRKQSKSLRSPLRYLLREGSAFWRAINYLKTFLEQFIVFSKGFMKKVHPHKILERVEVERTSFFRKFLDIFSHISWLTRRNRLKLLLNTINSIWLPALTEIEIEAKQKDPLICINFSSFLDESICSVPDLDELPNPDMTEIPSFLGQNYQTRDCGRVLRSQKKYVRLSSIFNVNMPLFICP